MAEIKTLWIPIDTAARQLGMSEEALQTLLREKHFHTARVSVGGDGGAKVWCMLKSDLAKVTSAKKADDTVLRPGEDGKLVRGVRKRKPLS